MRIDVKQWNYGSCTYTVHTSLESQFVLIRAIGRTHSNMHVVYQELPFSTQILPVTKSKLRKITEQIQHNKLWCPITWIRLTKHLVEVSRCTIRINFYTANHKFRVSLIAYTSFVIASVAQCKNKAASNCIDPNVNVFDFIDRYFPHCKGVKNRILGSS